MRIFGNVPQNKILIVDNSTSMFANQLENGIPILPFENNPMDRELESLTEYLSELSAHEDIVSTNGEYFSLLSLRKEADMFKSYLDYLAINNIMV